MNNPDTRLSDCRAHVDANMTEQPTGSGNPMLVSIPTGGNSAYTLPAPYQPTGNVTCGTPLQIVAGGNNTTLSQNVTPIVNTLPSVPLEVVAGSGVTLSQDGNNITITEKKPIRLEIACGQRKQDGWIGIDIAKTAATDIVHDLMDFPWPIESDSVIEAQCSHYIEHIPQLCMCCRNQVNPMFRFFDELWRVMKDGAKCLIIAPYWASHRAFQDPTHTRFICEHTFLYCNKQWRKDNMLDHYAVTSDCDFTYGYAPFPDTANRSLEAQAFWIAHYINAVQDIQVTLTKRPKKD